MANKAVSPKSKPHLFLHCKCDSCRHWEIVYVAKDEGTAANPKLYAGYYLKCVSCGEMIALYGVDPREPHAMLHWDTKE
jgi:ribosomal protein S27E